MNDLKLITLINGYEVIGEVIEDTSSYYKITQPLGIQVQPHDAGSYALRLVPYSAVDPEGTHKIFKHAISSECEQIPSDLRKMYVEHTSKIQIVGSI